MTFHNHADTIIGGRMMFEAGERISVKVEREDDDWRADDPMGTSQGVEVKREPGVGRKKAGRKKLKLKLFKCDHFNCGYSTKYNGNLHKHVSVHSDERPHKCHTCEKTFKTSNILKQHLKLHSEETPFQCQHCDYSCKSNPALANHLLAKHSAMEPWPCDHPGCQYTTRVKIYMKRHKNNIHESNKRFKCEECQQAFKRKVQLRSHSFVHTGVKPFKCQKCQYSSLDKRQLQVHEQRRHVSEKKHKCGVCGASYRLKDELEKHKLDHDDAMKKFKCDLCPFSALNKAKLYSHSQSHKNKGRYKCDECDRSFNGATPLKIHRFTHSKIKNLICHECDYRTNNPRNLRRHRLFLRHSVSKESRGEKCDHCGLALFDQSDSTTHRDAPRPCSVPLPRVTDSRDVIVPPILRRVKIELVVIKTENV